MFRIIHTLGHSPDHISVITSDDVLSIVKNYPGLCPHNIAAHMTWCIRSYNWEDFPSAQKWFAVEEFMAHLDYLCGKIFITESMIDGICHYN